MEIKLARSPKARALGVALRQAREDKHKLLRELGAEINRDIGVISRWETGERTPKPEQVAQILTTLGVNGERYDQIMTLAYGTNESQWVATTLPEQKQQMVAYVDWEQNANKIVQVAPLLVPGLLQTGDYARAIMTDPGSDVPPTEVAARVTSRVGRKEVLTRRNPAELLVLLGRGALIQGVGGKQVMVDQLQHLLEMAARPNVEIRIVPDDKGWHPGLEGAFALIESSHASVVGNGPEGKASVVFVETRRSDLMLHQDGDVAAYKRAIDRVTKVSLQPDVSVSFIADLRTRMEKRRGT